MKAKIKITKSQLFALSNVLTALVMDMTSKDVINLSTLGTHEEYTALVKMLIAKCHKHQNTADTKVIKMPLSAIHVEYMRNILHNHKVSIYEKMAFNEMYEQAYNQLILNRNNFSPLKAIDK